MSSSLYYSPEWFDNKSYFEAADLITVSAGQDISNIDAKLGVGGAIFGQVSGESGNSLPDVYVQVYDLSKNTIIFNSTRTNSEGSYTALLPPGDYKIFFLPGTDSGNYGSEWYNNKSDFQSSDTVTVKRHTKSKINAQLSTSEP